MRISKTRSNRSLVLAAVAGSVVATMSSGVQAQSSWLSAVNGSWFDGTKWSPTGVPNSAGTNVTLGLAGAYTVSMQNQNADCGTLTLSNSAAVLNVFDNDALTNFTDAGCGTGGCINTTVQTNRQVSTLPRFNPFSETPVEGVNWRKGSTFGQATSRFAFQTPRTYNFSVGFRF